MSQPARFGRYLVAIALATLWTLACAVAHTTILIHDHQASPRAPRRAVVQLPLPFAEFKTDRRPRLGKISLLTWGRRVLHQASCQTSTPPIRWTLPDWHAPAWFIHSEQLLAADS